MKLKKCVCGSKPYIMPIGDYSGYAVCIHCGRKTHVYDNDVDMLGQTWKEKVISAWNNQVTKSTLKKQ